MKPNSAKAKLKSGQAIFGCAIRYPEAGLAEMVGYHGWDFLVIDAEHGTVDPHSCENMVRAAELRGVSTVVRVTTNQAPVILRFLDTGAQGVQVPWVNTAAEADAAIRSVKYHPRGNRGLAAIRAADYGQTGTFPEYVKQANVETLVAIQIETAQGVENASEIAAVPDIDVLFIGPSDLSQSLGVPGQPDHPAVQAAMDRIVEAAKRANVALGVFVGSAAAARQWRDRGARYIVTSLESVVRPAASEYLRQVRG